MVNNTPWSGDVSQWIRVSGLEQVSNYWSQQTGLININNLACADPRAEQQIVEDVASYGRQLGWLLEAVDVLIHKLEHTKPLRELTHEEEDKLEQVKTLKHRIDEAKRRASV